MAVDKAGGWHSQWSLSCQMGIFESNLQKFSLESYGQMIIAYYEYLFRWVMSKKVACIRNVYSSLLLSCTNIVVITWIDLTNVNSYPQFQKKLLLTVQFGGLHIASCKTCILFRYSRVALLKYIHSLEVLLALIWKIVT